MTERNIILLERLQYRIVNESKAHDQTTWARIALSSPFPKEADGIAVSCATASCAAGTACLLSGDRFFIRSYLDEVRPGVYQAETVLDVNGKSHDIDRRARKLLGLTKKEADILFCSSHSHAQTVELLDQLIAGGKIGWFENSDREWNS